jgi:hypothetical protein
VRGMEVIGGGEDVVEWGEGLYKFGGGWKCKLWGLRLMDE